VASILTFAPASAIAVFLSGIELTASLRRPLSWRAAHYVILRLLLDASTAALALIILSGALSGLKWFSGAWPSLVAGLAGPAILRSQLAIIGSGQESSYYGPATVFVRVQKNLDSAIDDIGAATQATWLTMKAMPAIRRMSLLQLKGAVDTYLAGTARISPRRLTLSRAYISSVMADSTNDEEKVRAILQHLLDNGGRRLIYRLVRDQQKTDRRLSKKTSP
jgi:hypothetical protein